MGPREDWAAGCPYEPNAAINHPLLFGSGLLAGAQGGRRGRPPLPPGTRVTSATSSATAGDGSGGGKSCPKSAPGSRGRRLGGSHLSPRHHEGSPCPRGCFVAPARLWGGHTAGTHLLAQPRGARPGGAGAAAHPRRGWPVAGAAAQCRAALIFSGTGGVAQLPPALECRRQPEGTAATTVTTPPRSPGPPHPLGHHCHHTHTATTAITATTATTAPRTLLLLPHPLGHHCHHTP